MIFSIQTGPSRGDYAPGDQTAWIEFEINTDGIRELTPESLYIT